MDGLAATGASAHHAYSHNGYTTNSRRHIFTGSLADLRGDHTLIDDFHANGYEVAYFSGQDDSFGGEEMSVHPERADLFFDARQDQARRYSTFASAGSLAVPYEVVLEHMNTFLTSRDRSRPLFLYVNFHDTHFPYWHKGIKTLVDPTVVPQSEIGPARQADVRKMYLNTAANVDAAIGAVLNAVRESTGADPAVVITSDHGESLFDEGFLGHGYALNDAQTRVPLIVNGLSAEMVEPFAQSSIRDLIWRGLTAPTPQERPTVRTVDSQEVFQYLGGIESPRQIALNGLHGRRMYDFRENRARIGESAWRTPLALSAAESRTFSGLVQFWERLKVAGSRGPTPPAD
jgi:arylsulfatase A-like enzyme